MLNTEITLRNWTEEDLETLVFIANDPDIAANMTDSFPHPYTLEAAANFIKFSGDTENRYIQAIVFQGQICGSIGLHFGHDVFRKNAELGYWIGKSFHNKGIATSAVLQMVQIGFERFQFNRIFARPFPYNVASIKVLEKNRFQLQSRIPNVIYKQETYMDELIYGIYNNS